MIKRIVAAVFASAVVLVPLSAPAQAAEKPAKTQVIDWESAPTKTTYKTNAIDWE